jgi:hypothetical protein
MSSGCDKSVGWLEVGEQHEALIVWEIGWSSEGFQIGRDVECQVGDIVLNNVEVVFRGVWAKIGTY